MLLLEPSIVTSTKSASEDEPVKPVLDVATALRSLEQDTMGETWVKALAPEFKKSYFQTVLPVTPNDIPPGN